MNGNAIEQMTSKKYAIAGFILLAGVAILELAVTGGFDVQRMSDSYWYQSVAEAPFVLSQRLSSIEPPLYPLFLRGLRGVTGSYAVVPPVQFVAFAAAALALLISAQAAGLRALESFVVAAPLIGSTLLGQYGSMILSETLAASFAISCVALSLLAARRGTSMLLAGTLGATSLLACLTRPSFLFLPLMVPLTIAFVSPCFRQINGRSQLVREFVLNASGSLLPFAVYACLRLVVVGEFGIVSSGGLNITGIALSPAMLTASDTSQIQPGDRRRLAAAIVIRREALFRSDTVNTPPYAYDVARFRREPMVDAVMRSYDATIWKVAVPAAGIIQGQETTDLHKTNFVSLNESLLGLSREMIRLKPGTYIRWVGMAGRRGLQDVFRYEVGARWAIGLTFALFLVILGMRAVLFTMPAPSPAIRSRRFWFSSIALACVSVVVVNGELVWSVAKTFDGVIRGALLGSIVPVLLLSFATSVAGFRFARVISNRASGVADASIPAIGFAAVASIYFLAGLGLVVLVEMPQERYIIAVSGLLPGAVLLLLIHVLKTQFRGRAPLTAWVEE